MLKDRAVIAGRRRLTIDYCQYRDARFPPKYRKRTNLWTSAWWFGPRPLCSGRCRSCDDKRRHMDVAQRAPSNGVRGHKLGTLYAIPPQLPEDILGFWQLAGLAPRGSEEGDPKRLKFSMLYFLLARPRSPPKKVAENFCG